MKTGCQNEPRMSFILLPELHLGLKTNVQKSQLNIQRVPSQLNIQRVPSQQNIQRVPSQLNTQRVPSQLNIGNRLGSSIKEDSKRGGIGTQVKSRLRSNEGLAKSRVSEQYGNEAGGELARNIFFTTNKARCKILCEMEP